MRSSRPGMKERRLLQLIPARGERNGEEKEAVQLMGEALSFHKPGISIYSCKPYRISLLSQKKRSGTGELIQVLVMSETLRFSFCQ